MPRKSKARKSRSGRSRDDSAAADRQACLDALPAESRRQLRELIERRLALPLEERMNFLRRRLPGGGSCL
jgi:hypothetical protein